MKQRDAVIATLLSVFIPFYVFYWLYVTANQLKAKGLKTPSILWITLPVLVLIGLWLLALLLNATPVATDENTRSPAFIAVFVLIFAGIPVFYGTILYYYYRFSQAVEQVTNKAITAGILTILFVFISPVAVYIIQDKLNNLPPKPAS